MLVSLVLAAALSQSDCEAMKAAALPAIEHANGDFVRALKAREPEAIAAAYADDGLFVMPDGKVLVGRAAVRDLYAASSARSAAIQDGGIESQGLVCGASGQLYEWGRGWLRVRGPDGKDVERGGPYLTVWKQVGGQWKITRNLAF
ncbi:MAG TPA: DUF4440 domain-containing protein [Phenylobacterium sp.]